MQFNFCLCLTANADSDSSAQLWKSVKRCWHKISQLLIEFWQSKFLRLFENHSMELQLSAQRWTEKLTWLSLAYLKHESHREIILYFILGKKKKRKNQSNNRAPPCSTAANSSDWCLRWEMLMGCSCPLLLASSGADSLQRASRDHWALNLCLLSSFQHSPPGSFWWTYTLLRQQRTATALPNAKRKKEKKKAKQYLEISSIKFACPFMLYIFFTNRKLLGQQDTLLPEHNEPLHEVQIITIISFVS